MKEFTLYFLVLIITNFITTTASEVNLPKIYPTHDEVVFESNWNLTLGCAGVEPVTWTLPESVSKKKYTIESVNISRHEAFDPEYLFGSILTVTKASVFDIGYYICHEVTANQDNPTKSKNIYVYVRDENQLYVSKENKDPINIRYYIHLKVTVPCMPTSPDVSVTLLEQRNDSFHEVPAEHTKYDPHSGFSLKASELYSFSTYKCEFHRNNQTQILNVIARANDVLDFHRPYVDVPDKYILKYAGEDLELNCSVVVEEESAFKLDWILPNNSIYHSNRLNIRDYPNLPTTKYKILLSKLLIKNLTSEDNGRYQCFLAPGFKELNYTVHMTVIDRKSKISVPKIHSETKNVFINSNTTQVVINSDKDLTLHCISRNNITWSYPKHQQDTNNVLIKYSVTSESIMTVYHSTLILTNSHYLNGGFYFCYEIGADIENPYKSSNIFVFVKDKENLSLSPIHSGQYITASSINDWIPCIPSFPDVKVTITQSKVQDKIMEYNPRHGFRLNSSSVNDITCQFERRRGPSEYKTIFIARKFIYEFIPKITAPINEVIHTSENLILTCTIVVDNTKDYSVFWYTPVGNKSKKKISKKFIPIYNGKVIISSILIENIQSNNEGWYNCSLENLRSSSVYIKVNTIIYEVKPSILAPTTAVGDTAIMYCNVKTNHNVQFHLKWDILNYNDTRIMVTDAEYFPEVRNYFGRSALIIKNVTLQDQHYYFCSAFDSNNNKNSVSAKIIVLNTTKPKIYETNMTNTAIKLNLGDPMRFTCLVEGIPEPKIIWTINKTVINQNDPQIQISNNTKLTIDHVKFNHSGDYACNATNRIGTEIRFMTVTVQKQIPKGTVYIIIIVVLICLSAIVTVVCNVKLQKMKKLRKNVLNFHFQNPNKNEAYKPDESLIDLQLLSNTHKWELPRNKIKIREKLGSGNFGLVMKADLLGNNKEEPRKIVAVKMINNCFDYMLLNLFISELKIMMCHVGKHLNIISLIGVNSGNITKGELFIIVEYCQHGNIRDYLLKNRNNFKDLFNIQTKVMIDSSAYITVPENNAESSNCYYPNFANNINYCEENQISTKELVYWSFQISRGMEYLASKNILHGDLAARNILLTENNIIKICDFGLSKNLYNSNNYKKKTQVPLPIRWMAIESIRDGIFSKESDVWSFGIVLWEIFSLARTPYSDMFIDSVFTKKLASGYRMDRPQYASEEIYQIMMDCWHEKSDCRPTFAKLACILEDLLEEDTKTIYAAVNESYNMKDEIKAECNNYLIS